MEEDQTSTSVTGWLAIAEPQLGKVTNAKPVLELGHDAGMTASHVGQLLAKEWKLPRPRVILSIVSGTKSYGKYGNDKNVESAMQEGLIKAMKTTQCWVLTNGLDGGMSKILGDALQAELKQLGMKRQLSSRRSINDNALLQSSSSSSSFKPVLIGIAQKSMLKYSDSISSSTLSSSTRSSPAIVENEGHRLHQHHFGNYAAASQAPPPSPPRVVGGGGGRFELNPAHTHFILVKAEEKASVSRVWNDVVENLEATTTEAAAAGNPGEGGGGRNMRKRKRKRAEMEKLNPMNLIENPLEFTDAARDEVDTSPSTPSNHEEDWLDRDDLSVPLICILVKGGVLSLRLALDHLSRGTPVVVIGDTGGAAIVLQLAIRFVNAGINFEGNEDNHAVEAIKKHLMDHHLVATSSSSNELSALARVVVSCVSSDYVTSGLLTLVSSTSKDELRRLDRHLLTSLLHAQRRALFPVGHIAGVEVDADVVAAALKRDFLLTVDWNQPEIAEKFIFNEFRSWMCEVKCPISYAQFEYILLHPGYEAFVDLCLSQKNFVVSHHLTLEKAGRLFYSCLDKEIFDAICLAEILGLDSEELKMSEFLPHRFNDLVWKLVGISRYLQPPKKQPRRDIDEKSKNYRKLLFRNISSVLDRFFSPTPPDLNQLLFPPTLYSSSSSSSSSSCQTRTPEADAKHFLFLWAVLMCKPGLAFTIWKHLEDPIPSALVAAILFRNMATYSTTVYVTDQLEKDSEYFVQVAVDVLNAGFEENDRELDDLPYNLFDSRAIYWGDRFVIDIAYDAGARDFFSHPCCQRYLTTRMYGHLQIRSLHFGFFTVPRWLKVIFSAIFILPMFFWIRFSASPRHCGGGAPVPPSSHRGSACPEPRSGSVNKRRRATPDHDDDDEMGVPDMDDGDGVTNTPSRVKGDAADEDDEEGVDGVLVSDLLLRRLLRPQPIPFLRRLQLLWAAPATRMWTAMISYVGFLLLFHLTLLVPVCGHVGLDLSLFVWTATILVEVCRHILFMQTSYEFFSVIGDVVEMILIAVFLVAFALLRLFPHFSSSISSPDPFLGRVVIALGLLFFHYRFIFSFLTLSSKLGPLVLALKTLIGVDFVSFLRLFVLTAAPSAIAVQALLFPGWPFGASSILSAFRRAVFSLFTIALEDLSGSDACDVTTIGYDVTTGNATRASSSSSCASQLSNYASSDDYSCPQSGFWPWFFWTQYLVLQKVVLMSLLYALFSTTMAKIKSDSQSLWLFRRYQVICKYEKSSPLPPPFSPLCYLYRMVRRGMRRATSCSDCCRRRCRARKGDRRCCFNRCSGNEKLPFKSAREGEHEAFFWSRTRNAFLADKSEKDRKREEKGKFLEDLSRTVSTNMLLTKAVANSDAAAAAVAAAVAAASSAPFQLLLEDVKQNQKIICTLEEKLVERDQENEELRKQMTSLREEIETLWKDSHDQMMEPNVND